MPVAGIVVGVIVAAVPVEPAESKAKDFSVCVFKVTSTHEETLPSVKLKKNMKKITLLEKSF